METGTVRLVVELPTDLHHKFKVKATIEGSSMKAVLVDCVKRYTGEEQPDRTTEDREDYKPGKK